ncbi:hypothetical protein KY290_018802 [Solanum tuberosum]|uniref:Uncharacterized protein n=1 Tax=Solanum tuberosum TaxID=4113 RepID=A0ABQ7VGN1_SOLTU|nr:hypothetical protein KY290_018802 [Solanum tuberosum]
MRRQLMMSWQRFCDDSCWKSRYNGITLKAACPVCLQVLSTPLDSDLKMTLAVHMSLWHADDVQLHWEMMQNKGRSIVHMPSFCFGAGMAAGIGAVMVIIARSHAQAFGNKR